MLMAAQEMKEYTLAPGQSVQELILRIQGGHEMNEEISLSFQFSKGAPMKKRVRVQEALVRLRGFMDRFGPVMKMDSESDEEEEMSSDEEEHFYSITELDDGSHELRYNDDLGMARFRAYETAKHWADRWRAAVRGDITHWRDVDGQTVQGAKKAGVLVTSDGGMDEETKINLLEDPRVLRWAWYVLDRHLRNHKPVVIPKEKIQWLKPEPELTLGENSEVTDKVLVQIAKDCIRHKWKQEPEHTFNRAENKIYRAIDAASTPSWGFWGGYSFLDEVNDLPKGEELMGFIRVYSPQGSAKFSFWVKDGKLMLCHA
jgi:hypothetical protein